MPGAEKECPVDRAGVRPGETSAKEIRGDFKGRSAPRGS